jgi:hypothetical protein
LLNRRRPLSPRDDERERVTRARRAAEALFTAKRAIVGESGLPDHRMPSPDRATRKPRVLKALSTTPVRDEAATARVNPEPRVTSEIPKSQFGRIRAWVNYGMTAAQVAAVYGVAVEVIERILSQS